MENQNLPSLINSRDIEIRQFCLSIKDAYTSDIKHFINYLDKNNLQFTFESFKAYIEELKLQGTPVRTANKRICAIKKRIRQLFEKNVSELDIVKKYHLDRALNEIKLLKKEDIFVDKDKIISVEEFRKLITSDKIPDFVKLIIEFLFKTGCRISETLNIRLRNIEEYKDGVKIRMLTKGGKEHTIKLDIETYRKIRDFYKGKEFLFEKPEGGKYNRIHITNRIRRGSLKILGKEISAHSLRHSFATYMIKKTGKIKAVSKYLAHSDTSITLNLYVHEELTMEDLEIA